MIHIGVSDLSFLIGAEMKYLATGQGDPNGRMSLVPNGFQGGTS